MAYEKSFINENGRYVRRVMKKLLLISFIILVGCGLKLPVGVTIKKDGKNIIYYCNRDAGCNMQELVTYIDKHKEGDSLYSIEVSGEDISDKY